MFNLAIRQILPHVVAVTRKKTFKACPLPLLKSPVNNYQKLPIKGVIILSKGDVLLNQY
jgi:hypothetical protein